MQVKTSVKRNCQDNKGKAKKVDLFERYNQRMAKGNIHYKMIELERQRKEKTNEA
jgi:hypothetical protein